MLQLFRDPNMRFLLYCYKIFTVSKIFFKENYIHVASNNIRCYFFLIVPVCKYKFYNIDGKQSQMTHHELYDNV
jgi:hypothetical protein